MNILFDLSSITDMYWGVSIYSFRVLKGLRDNKIQNITLLLNDSTSEKIHRLFPQYKFIVLPNPQNRLFYTFKIKSLIDSYYWKKTIDKSGCDILYSPTSSVFHFWKLKIKRVQTIHDIQGLIVYSGIARLKHKIFTPLILRNADYIITISDFVKKELLKTYSFLPSSKLKTIYNSVIINQDITITDKKYDYILYVNALKEYKNIMTLINAYLLAKDKINHKLVIVGKPTEYWNSYVAPYIESNNLSEDIIIISEISDDELTSYYKNASLFVTTSLYEGFGYTPIEAAICGTPVISTKDTALHETTMGMVNYYEPATDYISLKNKMIEILSSPPSIETLKNISEVFKSRYNYISQAKEIYDYISFSIKN